MRSETITFTTTDITAITDKILNIYSEFGVELDKLDTDKFHVAEADMISIAVAILTCNLNLVEAAIEQMLPIRSSFIDSKAHSEMCRRIMMLAYKYRVEKNAQNLY